MSATFTVVTAGVWVAVTRTGSDGSPTGAPEGGVPVEVATLSMKPVSMSAWVIVWVAEQVATSVGASVVTSQVGAASDLGSATLIPVIVTLPVLVTVIAYVITWPG